MQSISLALFLEPFKLAAAEGAVLELKLRLLAGKIPSLQNYAHKKFLGDIEAELVKHFDVALSSEEKEIFALCRVLRNKVLHADFRAAREKLNEMGIETLSSGVKKIDIPVVSLEEITKKIQAVKAGTEGTPVASASSSSGVYGWFLEAGSSGDFQKAADAFKRAAMIVDRLAHIDAV